MSLLSEEDCDRLRHARALVFDVDGTLYRQAAVRRAMLGRLLRYALRQPRHGRRTILALRAYRQAQESLRDCGGPALQQCAVAARAARLEPSEIAAAVERWMEREPLDLIARSPQPGLRALLRAAAGAHIQLGVFSDYPPAAKLRALGVLDAFQVVGYAQQPDVNIFKPDARGLLHVIDMLGVPPAKTVYVGDRPEVDSEVAQRAGVTSVIVGSARPKRPCRRVRSLEDLAALWPAHSGC